MSGADGSILKPGVADFGTTQTGKTVQRVVLSNGVLSAAILTYGAALQDVRLAGVTHGLTVGSPDFAAYEDEMRYAGTIVGPVANRIAGAEAVIDGQTYRFRANQDGKHTLHSGTGPATTQESVWEIEDRSDTHVTLALRLDDGLGGFPGNRTLRARFTVEAAALTLTLAADTDAPTLMNPTNHSYWRLGPGPTFAGHRLRIAADRYLPSTPECLPTGQIAPVAGTGMDFRDGQVLSGDATQPLDNNFCLSDRRVALREVASLSAPDGPTLHIATTEPGLQIFDGHILGMPDLRGLDGERYIAFAGLAMETQFWPDATNHPDFPPIPLRPGEPWEQVTRWRFER